jgi:hypothetical protein
MEEDQEQQMGGDPSLADDAAGPQMAAGVEGLQEPAKPEKRLFTVVAATIRAEEGELEPGQGLLAEYQMAEEEKQMKTREKVKTFMRWKRKGGTTTNSNGTNDPPATTLPGESCGKESNKEKREIRSRHDAKTKGMAGIWHESNFVEVLPDGQAVMLQNLPTGTMQSLMHSTDHVRFQAYFMKHGIEISSTLTEAEATAPQCNQNDKVPTRGRYPMFYWQGYDEKTKHDGRLDPRATGGSVLENGKQKPGRSYKNARIIDRYLYTAIETVLGLVTRGLQNWANWPKRSDTQPKFGVVGTGSVPAVHQELHCDNEASYKLALATSLAVYRPMIEQGWEKEAREIQKRLNCELGWMLHMPATLEGLALRVAVCTDLKLKTVKVREIFVPFGCCLLLRADVFHS